MDGEDFQPAWSFQDSGNFFRVRSGGKYLPSRFTNGHLSKQRSLFNIRNRVAFADDRNCGLVIKVTKITYEDPNQEFAKNRRLSESLHNASAEGGCE